MKGNNIIRWALMPVVFAGTVYGVWLLSSRAFGYILNKIFSYLNSYAGIAVSFGTSLWVYLAAFCICGILSGVTAVLVAKWIAPSHKKPVVIIAIVCLLALLVFLYFFNR